MLRVLLLAFALALQLTAAPAGAQAPNRTASLTVLPQPHWTRAAARTIDAARLTARGNDPAAATLTVADVAQLLADAAGRAEQQDHALQLQVLDWLTRLRREYPQAFAETTSSLSAAGALAGGMSAYQNPLRAREETDVPRYDADTLSAFTSLRVSSTLGGSLQLTIDAVAASAGVQLREAFAASRVGSVGIWAGRRRTGVVTMEGGGMVVDDRVSWDGGGIWLARPLHAPLLGPVHFETFLAAVGANGKVPEPWFWLTRGTIEPLPRFTIGATRAILFGDTAGGRAIDWSEFGKIVIGQNSRFARDDSYADNQILAVDGRWRVPANRLPLELYLTWGGEDSSGAWWKSPAIIGGIFLPTVPGASTLGIGIEHAVFTGAQGHGHFYEHGVLTEGWADAGRLIGHPLGGTGREWLLYGGYDRGMAGPAIQGQVFRRVRPPGNRLSPIRAGTAWGGELNVACDVLPALRLHGNAALELGSGWKTGAAAASLEWRLSSPRR
jgi:hypothetical protein